jgi:hypothetical protein
MRTKTPSLVSLLLLFGAVTGALVLPLSARAQSPTDISVDVAPPDLLVADQPPIPGDGYLWSPGYWAWSDDDQDYAWVPGTWVPVPQPGLLWTPGYWAADGDVFVWYAGYWGPHVGFYGGVDYGYGFGGSGYEGGYWQGGRLFYNRAVSNVAGARLPNVYTKAVPASTAPDRTSFNGGSAGTRAQPSAIELAAAREGHLPPTAQQQRVEDQARSTGVRPNRTVVQSSYAQRAEKPRENPASRDSAAGRDVPPVRDNPPPRAPMMPRAATPLQPPKPQPKQPERDEHEHHPA